MPWWGWMGIGMLLLAAELFIIEADFYLVFLGVAAALTGLLGLAVPGMPPWLQWLAFAVLSLVLMVLIYFIRRGFLKDEPPIGKVIGVKLLSSLIFLSLSLGFLYFTFLDELDPLLEVIKQSV